MLADAARRSAGDFEENAASPRDRPLERRVARRLPQVVSLLLVGGHGDIALRDVGLLVTASPSPAGPAPTPARACPNVR
jgi:hypothetical protein